MKWPPMVLYLKIRNQRHGFGLWIPLFLIGPLFTLFLLAGLLVVLPFVLIALLLAALAVVFEWQTVWLKKAWKQIRWAIYGIRGFPALVRVLCNLPGTKVDVDTRDSKVYIAIY